MPYIQVELDAVNAAPDVARLAGITDDAALAGMVRLWVRCLRAKSDRISAGQVGGVFGGDGERVADALVEFGFLEPAEGGYRVRGADRYLRLSEARRQGGLKSVGNLKRGPKPPGSSPAPAGSQPEVLPGCRPALTPITNHHSPITNQEEPMSAEPTPSEGAVAVFEHWRQVMKKNGRALLDRKRRKAIEGRLRDGYSVDDLRRAVDGCAVTPHNMGQNDNGQRYDDIELICRTGGHVERFMANAASPPRPSTGPPKRAAVNGYVRASAEPWTEDEQNESI